ncbi:MULTISPECIES: hypothetical protein [Paenibacillus]|uniref:Uncharacterized protein n=2 Tax=Paenibacillus TaxID=44249 RepID=A0ABX2ZCB1_PAEPO|nr:MULTISPECIES: hypothetical protein [Paenibacillus]MDR6779557.1 hypothetical protein [Paenibacillus peoriae]ODA09136.1 hypothetical protein A7312_27360 [Paenibacillus polymyxa]
MCADLLEYEIPFEDIDVEMIEIIKILNFKCKIKTKYCCFGHRDKATLYIMFHEDMNDYLEELATKTAEKIAGVDFSFHFWIRKGTKGVLKNWSCKTNGAKTKSDRCRILKEFAEVVSEFYVEGEVTNNR